MKSYPQTSRWFFLLLLIAAAFLTSRLCIAADPEEARVTAPQGTARLADGLGGAYFVDAGLLKEYNELKLQLKRLSEQIRSGKPTSKTALSQLQVIEEKASRLRKKIEAAKTFVSAYKIFKKAETKVFPLAASRRVIVMGDNVKMRGWKGPGIKVVLEKIVLAKVTPAAAEFDAIRINHQVKVDSALVGLTPAERAADRRAFRESDAGKKMTEAQLAAREAFWKKQFSGYNVFADFQGKAASVLSVAGLQHEEGNRQISSRITSPGGGATVGSEWRRHVSVTIYVPPCDHVLIAGCQVKLDIKTIEANLLLSTSKSRDRDYQGTFEVRGIKGNVTIDQAPVRLLDNVQGNVHFTATNEFVNAGTNHSGGFRTAYHFEMANTRIQNISGNLTTHFVRTNLQLNQLHGSIDVTNEFGNTELRLHEKSKIENAMRVISASGEIELTGPKTTLSSVPLYAHTMCGTLHTNLRRDVLEDVSFSTGAPSRSWSGFVTPSKQRFSLDKFERPASALENSSRNAGLDLISQSGRVSILHVEDAE